MPLKMLFAKWQPFCLCRNVLTYWRVAFSYTIFKHVFLSEKKGVLNTISLKCVLQILIDDESTLMQVMAWCHQATSHCQNQYCPRSMMPYSPTSGQWVNFVCCVEFCGQARSLLLVLMPRLFALPGHLQICHQLIHVGSCPTGKPLV